MISAKVILDSVGPYGDRITTFELRYPKFIHGEMMTHRMFSRNASSSRAIPTHKLISEVEDDATRAAPVEWGKNQKGMQADGELTLDQIVMARDLWRAAALDAIKSARKLMAINTHKQVVNRILEPFLHINVVLTSCTPGLMNFFGLRLHKDAQPEMRTLAKEMWSAYRASTPASLLVGAWHLPYVDASNVAFGLPSDAIKVSVARCARVSYKSFETGRPSTVEEDLKLYDRLLSGQPIHASPAEHQAQADGKWMWSSATQRNLMQTSGASPWLSPQEHGNLVGWRQFRKMLPNEACAPLPENIDTFC